MEGTPRVSGAPLLDEIAVAEARFGRERVSAAIERMPQEHRELVQSLTPVAWVSRRTVRAFFDALGAELGRDPHEVHRQLVVEGVERTFHRMWRLILRVTSDQALVRRTPLIYSRVYDGGQMSSRIVEPGRAELRLTGWRNPPQLDLDGIAGGIEAVLRVAGRKNPRVTWKRRPQDVLFWASWRI